ncbi:6-phosphofructo-2-kinase-domain-containing protein [Zopfochytrium polystomum]|nr:6-phosphofructo-2-kinase-domain-containing protein [Zopfochytrium polystomum]
MVRVIVAIADSDLPSPPFSWLSPFFQVGLPARGKSYICKKLCKYLSWSGFRTKVFNVGNRRRDAFSLTLPIPFYFYSALQNAQAKLIREQLAMETLEELIDWLNVGGGKVAIHDATNSTAERRRAVLDRVRREKNIEVVFVESICTDGKVLEANINMKLKGPDYVNMPPDEAKADFIARMRNYEKVYETISEEEEEEGLSFIKIMNVGRKIIAHGIHGFLQSQCVFYLMQIHIKKRVIWLTRHGQSTYNVFDRIGGDAALTDLGARFGAALARFLKQQHPPPASAEGAVAEPEKKQDLSVWTSTLERTMATAEGFDPSEFDVRHMKYLNEINAGICEHMSYAEIEKEHPEVWAERQKNKLLFRYPGPGGESYLDVIDRLRPVIVELERMESNILIVTHRVVMRTLLAYFCGLRLDAMPSLPVPLHSLYKVEPTPYGADVTR